MRAIVSIQPKLEASKRPKNSWGGVDGQNPAVGLVVGFVRKSMKQNDDAYMVLP